LTSAARSVGYYYLSIHIQKLNVLVRTGTNNSAVIASLNGGHRMTYLYMKSTPVSYHRNVADSHYYSNSHWTFEKINRKFSPSV